MATVPVIMATVSVTMATVPVTMASVPVTMAIVPVTMATVPVFGRVLPQIRPGSVPWEMTACSYCSRYKARSIGRGGARSGAGTSRIPPRARSRPDELRPETGAKRGEGDMLYNKN